MSGAMSKYILEDEDVECMHPDIGHCPIRCMSRSYAHLFLRFQNLEENMRHMRGTLDTVLDYVIRGAKSDSSDSDKPRDKKSKKKGKKSRGGSRSGSDVIDQDLLDIQATLAMDFSLLTTWKNSDDEGGKPKKPRPEAIRVCLKTGISSSEQSSGDEQHSEADDVVREVSQVIDDMAQVANDIQATAEIPPDVAEVQAQSNDENDEPEYAWDFHALYNELDELD